MWHIRVNPDYSSTSPPTLIMQQFNPHTLKHAQLYSSMWKTWLLCQAGATGKEGVSMHAAWCLPGPSNMHFFTESLYIKDNTHTLNTWTKDSRQQSPLLQKWESVSSTQFLTHKHRDGYRPLSQQTFRLVTVGKAQVLITWRLRSVRVFEWANKTRTLKLKQLNRIQPSLIHHYFYHDGHA